MFSVGRERGNKYIMQVDKERDKERERKKKSENDHGFFAVWPL